MRSSTIPRILLLAVSALPVTVAFVGCRQPGSGPILASYVPQTPFLSNVASTVQQCSNANYVSGNGVPAYPFEVDLTTTVGNSFTITKTVGSTTITLPQVFPNAAGVVAPPYSDSYAINTASPDNTYPLIYNVIDIYPNAGTATVPPVELDTYSIVETSEVTGQAASAPLTFVVQWGQAPPSTCWVAPEQPAPTNLSTAGGNNGDFLLQFSSPAWQTGGTPHSCSSPDTFEVQISSDSTFRLPARSLTLVPGAPQPAGAPSYPAIPGGTTDQTFNAVSQWNFECTYGGGNPVTFNRNVDPLPLSFGAITAPDVTYTNNAANPLFFRVRGIYFGSVGPWSSSSSFNVPAPTQNFNGPTDVCSFNNAFSTEADTFPCIPWNFQPNVSSWDLQVAKPGMTLGANAVANTLIASTNITATPGGSGTVSFGAFTGPGPQVNQFCGPSSWPTNTNPYCAWQPANLPGGPFIWAIRADYAGGASIHHGPWSSPFAGTWPARIVVPNVIGESVSTADTNIQNAGLSINCIGHGPTGVPLSVLMITNQNPLGGTTAVAGSCVSLTWAAASGGGSGPSFSTVEVENCSSDQSSVTVYYAKTTASSWTKLGSFPATCTIAGKIPLTSGQSYWVDAVSDSGSCSGLTPDQAQQTQLVCIVDKLQAPVLGGPSGTTLFDFTGSAP